MFEDHGIRFYINSREGKRHNEPHVHVDIRQGEGSGSFSLKTAEQLTGSKIRKKDQKIIKEIIENNQKDFLIYWNEHTDGLDEMCIRDRLLPCMELYTNVPSEKIFP